MIENALRKLIVGSQGLPPRAASLEAESGLNDAPVILLVTVLAESLTQDMAARLGVSMVQPTQAELLRAVMGDVRKLVPFEHELGLCRQYVEIEQTWPEESEHWRKRTPDWAPQGGESLLQVRARITRTLHELAARHPGQQIVLVAHGGVMDQLYRAATGQDLAAPRTWQLGNTAVNRLLWTPEGLSLVGWSDTSHLEDDSLDEISA